MRPHHTLPQIAKRLGCSLSSVRRAWNAVKDLEQWDEAPLWELNWALGRPPRLTRVSQAQMASITATKTLIQQAGLSLAARCQQTNT